MAATSHGYEPALRSCELGSLCDGMKDPTLVWSEDASLSVLHVSTLRIASTWMWAVARPWLQESGFKKDSRPCFSESTSRGGISFSSEMKNRFDCVHYCHAMSMMTR
nr:hypothetical protein CFP56_57597 [Quercus suber]